MASIDVLVLAASRKHGGRCIAGLATSDRRWVRPVDSAGNGELYPYHYDIDGKAPQLLDVVRFEHRGRTGQPDQPENLLIARSSWRRVGRVAAADAYDGLRRALASGPELFGSRSHYVDEEVAAAGLDASLALIEPTDLSFSLDRHSTKPQGSPRARFELDGQHYDLPLTESIVKPRLMEAGYGTHSFSDLGLATPAHTLLTVSLGTPFNGRHYKLVAAVIPLPKA